LDRNFTITLEEFKKILETGYKVEQILRLLNSEVDKIKTKEKEREEYLKIKQG
jgi:hypothetical protein